MFYRRILYLGQFVMAAVLPVVVLIVRGLLDEGAAWEFLAYLLICGLLAIVMFLVAGLTRARKSVRSSRAVSTLDAVILSAWYLSLLLYAIWPLTGFAIVALLLTVAAPWVAGWLLFTETRRRFRGMVAEFEQAARPPMRPGGGEQSPRVIVIKPAEEDQGS